MSRKRKPQKTSFIPFDPNETPGFDPNEFMFRREEGIATINGKIAQLFQMIESLKDMRNRRYVEWIKSERYKSLRTALLSGKDNL